MPGAWVGIRVAAFMLMLAGWRSTQIADLFGLSRWGAIKLIQKPTGRAFDQLRIIHAPADRLNLTKRRSAAARRK